MKLGSIPESLLIFPRQPRQVWQTWDDFTVEEKDTKKVTVIPVMVCDADKPKTHETAKKWQEGHNWSDPEGKKKDLPPFPMPNRPISGIRVVSLEHRGQGGRAYKVILPNNYYVDLREDILLDQILHDGIADGGVLKGDYVFARVGTEMKLVRVGSALHNQMEISTKVDKAKKITSKELVIGGVYKSKTETFLYLGRGNAIDIQMDQTRIKYDNPKQEFVNFKEKVLENIYLFVRLDSDNTIKLANIKKHIFRYNPSCYQISIPPLKEHICTLDINQQEIIDYVRHLKIREIEDRIAYLKKFYATHDYKQTELNKSIWESRIYHISDFKEMTATLDLDLPGVMTPYVKDLYDLLTPEFRAKASKVVDKKDVY